MTSSTSSNSILRAENVHKWYGKIHALKGFDFEIKEGEAVGLIGDNGAGKSTFAKIISGVISKNEGTFYWQGEKEEINSIKDARRLGIETVYQEQALVEDLSVAKNVFLGRPKTKYWPLNVLKKDRMEDDARELTEQLGLRVAPTQEVRFSSGGERQGVAIARAIHFEANLIILDEPTRALSSKGIEAIADFIQRLKEQGIAIILISHIFPHIFPVADRFVVLARGERIAEKKKEETSTDELSKLIIKKSAG